VTVCCREVLFCAFPPRRSATGHRSAFADARCLRAVCSRRCLRRRSFIAEIEKSPAPNVLQVATCAASDDGDHREASASRIAEASLFFRNCHGGIACRCCHKPRFDSLASVPTASYVARSTASRYDRHSLNHSLGDTYIVSLRRSRYCWRIP
jgi:hypothetical protein